MDADCSLGDGVKELVYVYKQLYHAAVERCGIHQDQLEQYSELLPKVKKIAELHDTYQIQRADKSKKKLDEVTLREDQWKQRYSQIQEEYRLKEVECAEVRSLCARLLARAAVARAESRAKDSLISVIKSRNKEIERKMQKKLSDYSQSLMRKYKALKESLEFSEAERAALVEANVEIELQLKTLSTELEEMRSEPSGRTGPHAPLPLGVADGPTHPCAMCEELQQKLSSVESKLAAGMADYKKLVEYIQEYKTRSTEKVGILKENIKKADAEIEELDKLIETIRHAMHCNMDLVKQSPQLLKALVEIDGTNSTQ